MANKKIQVTELDFDAIKQNLKTFFQEGDSGFTDYNFEGSGLSALLDVLAYNTHYNALYTNLAVNESFLDSASKRSSVVSKATELGYIPRSARSATAVVSVTMINQQLNAPTTIEIPRFSPFTATVDGKQFTFYSVDAAVASRVGTQYVFEDVEIKEGAFLEFAFTVTNGQTKFVLPNTGIDTSTLSVVVQENAQSAVSEVFFPAGSIIDLAAESKVYFIKEIDNEFHQIEFGDGVAGRALQNGNVVNVSYIVCSKSEPNGAKAFTYNGPKPANTTATVSMQQEAIGGADLEPIDSIKWNAPRMYSAQNRCVTAEDYRSTVMSLYPDIQAINVWGGDQNNPPEYGRVFLSIVPETTDFLSADAKEYIINEILGPRKNLTVTPIIVDPDYLRIQLDVAFYYNPQLTTLNATDIASLVRQTIVDYDDENLNKFGNVFKQSRLSTLIDESERSITSNITTLKLHREVTPVYGSRSGYTIDISNPIFEDSVCEESIISTGFYTPLTTEICYIDNDPISDRSGVGNLRLFYRSTTGVKVVLQTIGTLNYRTGRISITDLTISSLDTELFKFIIRPQSYDVVSVRNQFVTIDQSLITITPVIDISTNTYKFTSSRS